VCVDKNRKNWYPLINKALGAFLNPENMNAIIGFFREAKSELLRVNWPSRKEVIRYTLLVVGISLFVAVFLGTLDATFSWLVERFLLQSV
jgi:preprotein translocase subunit SecE